MTHLIRHEQCPKCKSIGNDTSGNNLAIYSDEHQWCFACGYYVSGNKIAQFKSTDRQPTYAITLPFDASIEIPTEPLQWFYSYDFDENTLKRHHVMWSESKQMLLFPYFIEGELLGWQGRCFGEERSKRKWFTQGKIDDFLYTIGQRNSTLVLTEAIISAIKVGRIQEASPCFGSHISNQRLLRISKFYDKIIIWLDPDKHKEAICAAKTAQLFGLETHTIISDKKPKDYSMEDIIKWISN